MLACFDDDDYVLPGDGSHTQGAGRRKPSNCVCFGGCRRAQLPDELDRMPRPSLHLER